MHMIWKYTSGIFEQILFIKFITAIRLFGITSMIVEFLFEFPHGRFPGGYEIRQCQWAAGAPLGPNEHTTTAAAVHAGITSSQHSHMRASNFSNQWETRYKVNALKIIYDKFLLPNAQDIIETVRLLGRLSIVRSNLKNFFSYSGQKHWAILRAKTSIIWYVYDMKIHKRYIWTNTI